MGDKNDKWLANLESGDDGKLAKSKKDQFDQWRDHVKHEDTLINHRLTWLLVIQGLFFSSYVGLYSAGARLLTIKDTVKPDYIDHLTNMLEKIGFILPILGAVSSLLLWWSMIAAQNVVNHIMKTIDSPSSDPGTDKNLRLVGGSYLNSKIALLGHISIWSIAPLISLTWFVIECFSVIRIYSFEPIPVGCLLIFLGSLIFLFAKGFCETPFVKEW